MTESNYKSSQTGTTVKKPLTAVDLREEEAEYLKSNGQDFTEIKEAIVDSLLNLTKSRCIGEGEYGEYVYGVKPSTKLVSGFLLPRFDSTGSVDETSDLHISTMGIDLQISIADNKAVVVKPNFNVYVRVLPSWEEISDKRYDMFPRETPSVETQKQISAQAKEIIEKEIAKLPKIEEIDDLERQGDKLAAVKEKTIKYENRADLDSENGDSGNGYLKNTNGDSISTVEMKQAAYFSKRKVRYAKISEIRQNAYKQVSESMGIKISSDNSRDTGTISSEGHIDDSRAAPQPIPHKWKRIGIDLGEFQFYPNDEKSVLDAKDSFANRLREQLDTVLKAWIETETGNKEAYRPDTRILPSNFANKANWEKFLAELHEQREVKLSDIRPNIDKVELIIDIQPDIADSNRKNLRIAIENGSENLSKEAAQSYEHSIFQVELLVSLPQSMHIPFSLTRVDSSQRFADWLNYPAMGLNCGVIQLESSPELVSIKTTWSPRYTQPRTEPRKIDNVLTSYKELANEETDIAKLFALPDAYDNWIAQNLQQDRPDAESEFENLTGEFQESKIDAYKRESGFIRKGIAVLVESKEAYIKQSTTTTLTPSESEELNRLAIPWRAWILTNRTFENYGKGQFTDWRLFQLAFILVHIPTLASRMEEFADHFDLFRDEQSASLLYFPTGGGKSEAFFGLLVFNLFFDRLRGKNRGVSALIRYPLRLLTLQQARRLTKVLVYAEMVRLENEIGEWPFELGFWVGSGNTPNRVAQGFGAVPPIGSKEHEDDSLIVQSPDKSDGSTAEAKRKAERYQETLEAFDKLRVCPCCGSKTGMRKYSEQHGRIGIVCFNNDCDWNKATSNSNVREPLPFLLTDDTIYQRVPSVILGTIDKLALIGQHDRTINSIVGMFGCARHMDPKSKHLFSPRGVSSLEKASIENKYVKLFPAFSDGKKLFTDPFPSLIIQDEGHLLTESLGTFTGLFETMLEQMLIRLGKGILKEIVTFCPSDSETNVKLPRFAKIVSATATISDPDRQLRVLYQRDSLRFPCSGVELYESFFSNPQLPKTNERLVYSKSLPKHKQPELASPWMRIYESFMTNGHSHAVVTASIISAYHLSYTNLWNCIQAGEMDEVVRKLIEGLSIQDSLTDVRVESLRKISRTPNFQNLLASIFDLFKISITYVTSKKGGDMTIDTLQSKIEKDQASEGVDAFPFRSELISGGVTIAEIQDIMGRAEGSLSSGSAFPNDDESVRNVVATSAISHGVDVENFNAMFFVGLPSDIAEYIQASSRVGRTHPGFCMLIPTPYSRRDRYVLETHDQFHRFLERMISPPAVQRWADRAIKRIIPSVIQSYLCGIVEQELFFGATDDKKSEALTMTTAAAVGNWVKNSEFAESVKKISDFAVAAIGVNGRGEKSIGGALHQDHYRELIEDSIIKIINIFITDTDASRLSNYWQAIKTEEIQTPMTSLRDIDAGGIIISGSRDPFRRKNLRFEAVRQVMKIIRGQRLAVHSELDADPDPLDEND